jgi:DNA-binding MarR family transcriptional regulator
VPDRDALINASLELYSRLSQAMIPTRAACAMPWTDLPITLPQLRVLGVLYPSAGGLSGRELAGQLGVGPSAVTPLVDRLVEHGFVRREEDRADRRITRLLLTDAGLRVLERMTAGRRERMADLLRRLEADELAVVERAFALLNRAAADIQSGNLPSADSAHTADAAPSSAAAAAAPATPVGPVPAGST